MNNNLKLTDKQITDIYNDIVNDIVNDSNRTKFVNDWDTPKFKNNDNDNVVNWYF